MCPASPATELKRMKSAATPEAFFTEVQLVMIMIGERKIPPPTPIKPEKSPITEPIPNPHGRGIGLVLFAEVLKYSRKNSIHADTIRNRPAISLKYAGLIEMYPPINAIGKAVIINDKNTFLSNCPAFIKLIDAMEATTILSINEVGFIEAGANDKSTIIAR